MCNAFRYILICAIVVPIFNSCKDKNCEKKGTCPKVTYRFELGEAKKYLTNPKGSYWIYKNTTTNELDTHTLISFKIDTLEVKGTANYSRQITVIYDKIYRTVYSTFNKKYYYEKSITPYPDGTSFNSEYRIIMERYSKGNLISFFYPFILNGWAGETKCSGVDTSMVIQGAKYINLVRFEIEDEDLWNKETNISGTYYWAKDVGMVKMTINSIMPVSWELIEYKIN